MGRFEASDKRGITPLHVATATRNKQCVYVLLRHGAKINALGSFDESPLHVACAVGDEQLTEMMLRLGAEVNMKTYTEDTPLHVALLNGQGNCVDILLKYGADPNTPSNCKVIPLSPGKIMRLYYKPRRGFGDRPLHYAVSLPSVGVVRSLIAAHADVNLEGFGGRGVFSTAVASGSIELVEGLVAAGCEVNVPDKSGVVPLNIAIGLRDVHMVKWLLEHEFDPNTQISDKTSIAMAIDDMTCPVEIIKLLLDYGAKVNLQGGRWLYGSQLSLLHIASYRLRADVVSLLISRGALVNVQSTENKTPLMITPIDFHGGSRMLSSVIIIRLLSHVPGIDLETRNNAGSTILHICAQAEKPIDFVRILLEAGADPTALNNDGNSPADIASVKEVTEMIQSYVGKVRSLQIQCKVALLRSFGPGRLHFAPLPTGLKEFLLDGFSDWLSD
ncbi:ankyrin repeat, PH and SEC7 domain containing protein secG-like isoform X1 [Corticium candelabrum]|uniref:ankyrin repeat, PH and SEC7 domain containing protein secG-like isoform X1 n=1 Tax=Corticium candelabrum TaxID=121492 RepID=UPI002E261496|nr:ankyrin repeat, PH and SEC7 domain containing protein secG-like isoform X1 [Corticium candelabrum]